MLIPSESSSEKGTMDDREARKLSVGENSKCLRINGLVTSGLRAGTDRSSS